MVFTLLILILVLGYMWGVVPLFGVDRWVSACAIVAVLGLALVCHLRKRPGWGVSRRGLLPGLGWALAFTLPALAAVLLAGWKLGTLHLRDHLLLDVAGLLLWALAQQFVLQTVVFREASERFQGRVPILLAAGFFALLHLPNPFLTPVTFLAALAWCEIYRRHPNLIPLALSHALTSAAVVLAFDPRVTGGMRVGYGYFLTRGVWL
jgi:membrane protease YdiL (CAAX protease family)